MVEELPYFHVLDKAMQCKNSIGCKIKGKVTVNKVHNMGVHVSAVVLLQIRSIEHMKSYV